MAYRRRRRTRSRRPRRGFRRRRFGRRQKLRGLRIGFRM